MKELFLKWVYRRYRQYFFNFFVEETIGQIPSSVSEPSMKFLANGKDKLTRWAHYWIHIIQSRITIDKREIEQQQGMILMLKIFVNLVNRQAPPVVRQEGEEQKVKKDNAAEVEAAISDYRNPKKEEGRSIGERLV